MTTKTIASARMYAPILALILTAIVSTGAHARVRSDVSVTFDRHGGGYVRTVTHVAGLKQIRRKHERRSRTHARSAKRHHHNHHGHAGKSVGGLNALTPGLAAKARELIDTCGAKFISGYRPGASVRGYGTPSLHSRYPAEAVDLTGDTSCIYPRMRGWPGGYSIDYAAVRHIHISLASDRRERGARFVHYGTRRYAGAHRR